MSKEKIKDYFKEFILINAYLSHLFISTISNYSINSSVLKISSTCMLLLIMIVNAHLSNYNLKNIFISNSDKKYLIVLLIFLFYPLFTLLYSINASFGLLKWLHLVVGIIPSIIVMRFIIITWNEIKFKVLIISLSLLIVSSIIIIILVNPFSFSGSYSLGISNWSHVLYGRFAGAVTLFFLFLGVNTKERKYIVVSAVMIILLALGNFYSGLRSEIFGTIVIGIIYFIYREMKNGFNRNSAIIIGSIAVAIIIIINIPRISTNLFTRYDNLQSFIKLEKDPSLAARREALNICLQRFQENALVGLGFGGFRTYYKSDLPIWMKYPHNIVAEVAVEFGTIGLILFLLLIYIIFKTLKKISLEALLFFAFTFWLTLFSKDIPSQSLFFISLAFLGISSRELKGGRSPKSTAGGSWTHFGE